MTKEDLAEWLQAHDCDFEVIEGPNVTGWSVRVVHKKNKRYRYLTGPFDEREVPDNYFRATCDYLWIPYPDSLKEK
jgi:hypothetical protein